MNYKGLAVALIKPPAKVIAAQIIKSEVEYNKLFNRAIEIGVCLYHTTTTVIDGMTVAVQPWILDEKSIPKGTPEPTAVQLQSADNDNSIEQKLFCPYCSAKINSTPGRTLHVKSKHPDKLDDYKTWLQSNGIK